MLWFIGVIVLLIILNIIANGAKNWREDKPNWRDYY